MIATGHAQGEGFVGDKLSLPAPSPNSAPHTQSATTALENAILNNIRESQVSYIYISYLYFLSL